MKLFHDLIKYSVLAAVASGATFSFVAGVRADEGTTRSFPGRDSGSPSLNPRSSVGRRVIAPKIPYSARSAAAMYSRMRSFSKPGLAFLEATNNKRRDVVSQKACTDLESTGFAPSDSTGAQGLKGSLSASNVSLAWVDGTATTASCRTPLITSLKSFFNVSEFDEVLFDPQVQYVDSAKKFIVLAESLFQDSNDQNLYIGVIDDVSRSSAPSGKVYKIPLSEGRDKFCKKKASDFYDYPKMGIGANAIAVTSNNFGRSVYGTVLAFNLEDAISEKNTLRSTCFGVKDGLSILFNTNPSQVLNYSVGSGGNTSTMLLDSPGSGGGNTLKLYRLKWNPAGTGSHSLDELPAINLPAAWVSPQNASQPNTSDTVDVLDGRFVSAGTQIGAANSETVFNAHSVQCVDDSSFSCVRGYKIQPSRAQFLGPEVRVSGASSFNASLAYNGQDRIYLTSSFSSSDLKPGTSLTEFLFKNGKISDVLAVILNQGNGTCKDGGDRCRWGDYSQTTLVPSTSGTNPRIGSKKVVSYDQNYTGSRQSDWKMLKTTAFFN